MASSASDSSWEASTRLQVYGDKGFVFPYVPSHLHHMIFELVKNSLRAVNDRFEDSDEEAPPVRVVIAQGGEDVAIKVHSDRVVKTVAHAPSQ